jgi:myo-inositol 2-dehydrogenase/D-chiro-inositol 1-dehydrogenase
MYMSGSLNVTNTRQTTRRQFLANSGLLAAAATAGGLAVARSAHAAGEGTLKVGLIGCGGRGSGAAGNAMNAGEDVRLVAMADIFEDKVQGSLERLKQAKPDQVAVDDDHCFVGFDAYRKVIESDVDVVIIATTSHFQSMYLKAAVEAGKHVFCEKPHSLDVPGIHSVTAACREAENKGLSVVSGLCWRYDDRARETMKRVHDGAIGEILAIQETYMVGPYGVVPRDPNWSELQYQFRNWYHFNWLAGDQVLQQLIHSIDKGAWALRDQTPVKAWGIGGRSNCFGPQYGDLFDHQGIVYEYADGVRMYGVCRNHVGCYNELSDTIYGTRGKAYLSNQFRIEGATDWRYKGSARSMYDLEHQALFDSIRSGKPINNGLYMARSTLLALLGQFVCHTGKEIAWEQLMGSRHRVTRDRYDWDMKPPIEPNAKGEYDIAVPGLTKFE